MNAVFCDEGKTQVSFFLSLFKVSYGKTGTYGLASSLDLLVGERHGFCYINNCHSLSSLLNSPALSANFEGGGQSFLLIIDFWVAFI